MNWNEIKTLCGLYGTSGRESAVRAYLTGELDKIENCNYIVDKIGNVIVEKKGEKRGIRKLLFTAHMDEVALMVTAIHSDGTLAFDCVGGVNAAAVIGRQVWLDKTGITGVIGCKPIHLLGKDAQSKPADMAGLYCDIGAESATDAAAYVRAGDILYFQANARDLRDGSLASKAIDDRFGCGLLLDLLRQDLPYDLHVAFVVQEEVGLRGAGVAARSVDADCAVVFEATTAADVPDSTGANQVCRLGAGAVISCIDGRTVYDAAMYELATKICESAGIPWQTKSKIAGGNDAGAIQNAGRGCRVLAVSIPCRYLHAPTAVVRTSDGEACAALAYALVSALQECPL